MELSIIIVIIGIGLIISIISGVLLFPFLFLVKLKTHGDTSYHNELFSTTRCYYKGIVQMTITPRIRITIHDFYIKIGVNGSLFRKGLSIGLRDENGEVRNTDIGKGYVLNPSTPIVGNDFNFGIMTAVDAVIGPVADIILEAGIRRGRWAIRKQVLLNTTQLPESTL